MLRQERRDEEDQKSLFPMQPLQKRCKWIILRQGISSSEVLWCFYRIPLQNGFHGFYLGVGIADEQYFAHGEPAAAITMR